MALFTLLNGVLVLCALCLIFQRALLAKLDRSTVRNDLRHLNRIQDKRSGTALIIGGSISGLLAAAVLRTHFPRVLMVEVDPDKRKSRVIQHDQLHVFLPGAVKILEHLLPSFINRLVNEHGAICHPNRYRSTLKARDVLREGGQTLHSSDAKHPWLQISREVFEAELRKEVNPETIVGLATGLKLDGRTVKSVTIRSPDGSVQTIDCDFVVDATGPAQATLRFLAKLGFTAPNKRSYDPQVRYCSFDVELTDEMERRIDQEAGYEEPVRELLIPGGNTFDDAHQILCTSIGGRTWRYCVATIGEDPREPKSWPDFEHLFFTERDELPIAFARATAVVIEELAASDQPMPICKTARDGPAYTIKHSIHTLPENLIPIGDSITKLNPQYGQGIAKACIDVVSLDRALRTTGSNVVKAFLDLHSARIESLYDTTKIQDYAYPGTIVEEGETKEVGASKRQVLRWLAQAGRKDAVVGTTLSDVAGLVESPLTLLQPIVLARALYAHMAP